ncbi:MAG: glycine/sarcosine/betaine reductase selenoprotein B family protein [bacterium]
MNKKVNGFYFYDSPRAISRMENMRFADPSKTPWSPLNKPLSECKISLISTAGIHLKADQTFDYDRERREPTWGDPSHREISRFAKQEDCLYTHLHIDTSFLSKDRNVSFPVEIFTQYEKEGIIGSLAETLYSTMGYTPNFHPLLKKTAPLIAEKMKSEGVDAVFIFPV